MFYSNYVLYEAITTQRTLYSIYHTAMINYPTYLPLIMHIPFFAQISESVIINMILRYLYM